MKNNKFLECFGEVEDPRSHINRLHLLNDILLIGISSVLCGAETWKQMEEFAKSKQEFLNDFLVLPNGIPSDDTLNRVFSAINPKQFESCFINWASNLIEGKFPKEVISLDGKTVRGAKCNGGNSLVHIVSAWASDRNIVLGQVKVNEKSNEITAIPELLKLLDIEDTVITIDAMGTQTEIVREIRKGNADYILAVKGNQGSLLEEIKEEFLFGKNIEFYEDIYGDHGRIETRKCSVISELKHVKNQNDKWMDLNQIIRIESIREFKNSSKKPEESVRYYITSLNDTAKSYQQKIRSHWGIENKLHWILDVAFSEDASRKRNMNSAQNYSTLLKISLNILKNDKATKQGIAGKRLKAAWNNDYLSSLLGIKV